MVLLGSMILDQRVASDVTEMVTEADFYSEAHAAIYHAITTLISETGAVDLVLLTDALRDRKLLDDVGGPEYLFRLAESTPSAVNAPYYAKIVRDKAKLRCLLDATAEIQHSVYEAGDLNTHEVQELCDRAESAIFAVAERSEQDGEASDLGTLLQQTMEQCIARDGQGITGIRTGFYDLDEITSGLQPGEVIIVAARPSMGKTAFGLCLAEQIAIAGRPSGDSQSVPVGIISMEMGRKALVGRMLCSHSRVDSHRYRTNRLSRDDFRALAQSCDFLERLPISIDDKPAITVMELRAKARRMVAREGVGCLVVDYLQLMTAPGKDRESRQVEVSAISRGVKALARELEIPIVCLAQLNRGAETREGHRPRMADLRESGSIEQDADVIMLLHREEYYHLGDPNWALDNPDKVGVAEIIVAKQRNGPTGTVELTWDAKSTRFLNRSRGPIQCI